MEAGKISGRNSERVTSDGRIICHDIKCHLVIKVLRPAWLTVCRSGRRHMGRSQREKGKRGERELAGLLREYGYDCRRGQQYCGASGDADVVGLPGIHIECKRVEKLNLLDAVSQAVRDAARGLLAAVFHRRDRSEWLVTMRFVDWMELYREAEAGKALKEKGRAGNGETTEDGS